MTIPSKAHQICLASRPTGMPTEENFRLEEVSLNSLQDGELLLRTLYLSVDPYMRGRMTDRPSYVPPFQLDEPISGGIVAEVIESKDSDFKAGEVVTGYLPWADYAVVKGGHLQKVNEDAAPISTALGVLGMPGMTAYFGLLDIGKPKKGETVVISGAAGAVGTVVGQIAKLYGCRVVGIAGGEEKKRYLLEELNFDAVVDYKDSQYVEELKRACPKGVDVYFDNVGGDITDQVLKLINKHARIVICGQIAMYNLSTVDVGPRNFWILLTRSALAQGFIVSDYSSRFSQALPEMAKWVKDGKIKYRESIVQGLENAPKAFLGLFKGENIGKQLVQVARS